MNIVNLLWNYSVNICNKMNKILTGPFRSLLYIPYKQRVDIVKTVLINGTAHYCVDDITPSYYVPNSQYIWNKHTGSYDQYQPNLSWMDELTQQNHKDILKQFSIHM